MLPTRPAPEVLDRDFLEVRGKILELAASLDRLDRSSGRDGLGDDPRLDQLRRALATLSLDASDRAASIQLIFSDPYDPSWQGGGSAEPRF